MKTKSKEPIKEHFKIRVFILMAIIVLYISIGKIVQIMTNDILYM
jgi:hypothetical protein